MTEHEMEEQHMLNKHDELIHLDILPRLEKVEKAQLDFSRQVEEIKTSQTNLELTVIRESREMQSTSKEQGVKMLSLVEGAMKYQSTNDKQEHEWRMEKLNTWATVFLKVMGGLTAAGGIGYLIVQHFFDRIG